MLTVSINALVTTTCDPMASSRTAGVHDKNTFLGATVDCSHKFGRCNKN